MFKNLDFRFILTASMAGCIGLFATALFLVMGVL